MQATLDATALKPFTRALTCLSRYGDELTIYATSESVSLSTTNSSKSAYSRFKFDHDFFSRYHVGLRNNHRKNARQEEDPEALTVTGQLLTKNLLSILKHRTVEKSVERCQLSIAEGADSESTATSDDEIDGLESKLIIKLLCKHGVVKTHRLLLSTPTSLLAPGVPESTNESLMTIGPASLRNMLEHFPMQKGTKLDPQLIWSFSEQEVGLRTSESSMDRGKGQISTELTISAEEFDVYNLHVSPIVLAFHLREFNATIAYADSMSLSLDLRFTDPAAPLFIHVEGDCCQGLFVISTSQVPGLPPPTSERNREQTPVNKRNREETPMDGQSVKKTTRIVQKVDATVLSRSTPQSRYQSRVPGSTSSSPMRPPSLPPLASFRMPSVGPSAWTRIPTGTQHQNQQRFEMVPNPEPLFLPSSQLSQAENNFLKEAGLGEIETMEDLNAILEGDGQEVDFSPSQVQKRSGQDQGPDSFELMDDFNFGPTQPTTKGFQPLFND